MTATRTPHRPEPRCSEPLRAELLGTESLSSDRVHPKPRWSLRARMRFLRQQIAEERGDVPGWVLITLMTAGLTVVIWGLAGPALSRVFEDAINRVSGM